MTHSIAAAAEPKMQKALDYFEEELSQVRGGRAQLGLVDSIKVDVYGQEMLVKQIATVLTPDARTIAIQPWDKANMAAIEKAIRETQSLGLNPSNDGHVIRLNIPPLTEERRAQLVKLVSGKTEACNIALRNVRHEVLHDAKKKLKDKEISEDEFYQIEKQLNAMIEKYHEQAAAAFAAKEREMMEL